MSKGKVLLIDDDQWLLGLYGERLKLEGYEVFLAPSGQEGFALAKKEKPSLILTDVVMASGDGFYLLDKVRADPEIGETKVVCLTNLSSSQDFSELENAGADGIIVKADYTPAQAVDKIRQILGDTK